MVYIKVPDSQCYIEKPCPPEKQNKGKFLRTFQNYNDFLPPKLNKDLILRWKAEIKCCAVVCLLNRAAERNKEPCGV